MPEESIEGLASVPVGADIEIVQDMLANSHHGTSLATLIPGDRFRCRFRGAASVLLTSIDGHTISIQLDEARFVTVRRRIDGWTTCGRLHE